MDMPNAMQRSMTTTAQRFWTSRRPALFVLTLILAALSWGAVAAMGYALSACLA